jgi:ATP-dependent Clp protease, protease subunit
VKGRALDQCDRSANRSASVSRDLSQRRGPRAAQKRVRERDAGPPRPRLQAYPPPEASRRPSEWPLPLQWELVIAGELSDEPTDLHERLVEVPPRSSGLIYFDSCGGSAYIGLALASLIRLRGLKATAIVAGECSSAAIMPFAACSPRFVTPTSTLLFHPVRWQSEEHVRREEAVEWARHFQVMEDEHDQLLAKLLGCPVEQVYQWSRPGRFVSGAELVSAGLASMVDLFQGDVWQQMARFAAAQREPA